MGEAPTRRIARTRSFIGTLGAVTLLATGLVLGVVAPASAVPATHRENVLDTDFVQAGVSGIGTTGTGSITVSGVTGPVTKALLFWHGINNTGTGQVYATAGITLDGSPVSGAQLGDGTTNCWGPGASRAYRADVTPLVTGNGTFSLAGLASNPGEDVNGASMIVFFDDGSAANNRDVALIQGNDSNFPDGFPGEDPGWHYTLPGVNHPGGDAFLRVHVADGQSFGAADDGAIDLAGPGGTMTISDIDPNLDGGSLPNAGGSRAANGGLYDIHSYDVSAIFGAGPTTGNVTLDHNGANDCLGLVVAALDLPAAASLPTPPSSLSINDVTALEGDSGTTPFAFTVSRTQTAGAAQVDFATSDITAESGPDYASATGTAVFADGAATAPVTVNVVGDTYIERDELFSVSLSNPVGGVIGDGFGVGTILNGGDVDTPPTFAITGHSAPEGNSGTTAFTFDITRTGTSGAASVDYYSYDITALAGDDYTAVAGTATFADGVSSVPVDVDVIGDTVIEADEYFAVQLSNPVGGTIATFEDYGVIINDDAEPTGPPMLSTDDVTLAEGDGGTTNMVFTVTRAGDTSGTATVKVKTTDATAKSASDYAAIPSTMITFDPGVSAVDMPVPVNGDTFGEAHETLSLALSAATGATLIDPKATGTITNDDGQGARLSISNATVAEGNSGSTSASFTVTRRGELGETVTLKARSADVTADSDTGDFTSVPTAAVTFLPGEVSKSVSVIVNGDTAVEAHEIFRVALSAPVNAVIEDTSGVGTIVNDDGAPTAGPTGTGILVEDTDVTEGDSGMTATTFVLRRTGSTTGTSTVKVKTTDATAKTASGDFTSLGATLVTFGPGDTLEEVTIDVLGDTLGEAHESFTLALSAPTGAVLLDTSAKGIITNDDGPGAHIAVSNLVLPEGETASFVLTRSGELGETVSVKVKTVNGTATVDEDYDGLATTTVTFLPGAATVTVGVPTFGDATTEGDEVFRLTIVSPVNAIVVDASATATLIDAG